MSNLMVHQVIDFNQKVLKIEQRELGALEQNEYEISVKCLKEELDEFAESYEVKDFIGSIDAMIDLMYFGIGVMYKMGMTEEMISKCFTAVHEANMEKKLGVNAKRAVDGAADAVKPEGWQSPEERIIDILDEVA